MTHTNRTQWTEVLIEKRLLPHIKRMGRMPSVSELTSVGEKNLACAISRYGGYHFWAQQMGVEQKGTETHRGQAWERHEREFFEGIGFEVARQSARHPFDLLINNHRVDVKSGEFHSYPTKHGKCSGYFFASLKCGKTCDIFDLVCHDGDKVLHRFIVPAKFAQVQTITITPKTIAGNGKYSQFENALTWLD